MLPYLPKIRIFVTKYFHIHRKYVFLLLQNTSTLAEYTCFCSLKILPHLPKIHLFCHKYEFEVRARFLEVFGDDKSSIEGTSLTIYYWRYWRTTCPYISLCFDRVWAFFVTLPIFEFCGAHFEGTILKYR